MEKSNKKFYTNGGLIYAGCMFIGLGIGMFFDAVAVGVLIGMGVGFIAMGILSVNKINGS